MRPIPSVYGNSTDGEPEPTEKGQPRIHLAGKVRTLSQAGARALPTRG